MKKILLILSLVLLFVSYFGYKYFKTTNLEFDKVYHYVIDYLDIRDEGLNHDNFSALQSGIVYNDYPYNLNIKFHKELTKVGFKKTEIENAKFSRLKEILKYDFNIKIGTKKCMTTYRDVLVFQKNNKIVGIVKICFGCGEYYPIGENLPNFNFEKYNELEVLLKK